MGYTEESPQSFLIFKGMVKTEVSHFSYSRTLSLSVCKDTVFICHALFSIHTRIEKPKNGPLSAVVVVAVNVLHVT